MSTGATNAAFDEVVRLLRFDTTSRDSNLAIVEYVTEKLRGVGVEPTLVPNEDGTKANLFATIPAADGTTSGGIVLSGHTDVVPVDGQVWASDPFDPVVRDGLLYGRGSCDMKAFIGVILAKLPQLVEARLAEPIHLAFSYDEEVGCLGAVSLIEAMQVAGLTPRGCIVGEPTSMRVVLGHKSINVFRIDFRGVAAHSSLTPEGVNAIVHASEFAVFAQRIADEFRDNGPFDEHYVVPFTTLSVNQINGGIAVNTVPAECSLVFEFRSVAAVDQAQLTQRFRTEVQRIDAVMSAQNPEAGAKLTVVAAAPGVDTPDDADIVSFAAACGAIPSPDKATFGTEAGLFAQAGIPTVVCGPGDIAQAHAPNEFIALEQIEQCERFLEGVIDSLSTSD
ncbi:acetylornithine deacetylase [Tessaracoccus bendigoensis DSM 12906]|uniref:Acetylornithine deacetylase n=1 Tax=Tessaracoccus bendigoensis DSM 12906 TaxID=1123357 RepID=A0A1M6CA85_9ACTN|nr:acetylornithine deacetylase [Tessaracoccus bendigoensis]SHI57937.1 acetylornithine deacetylase [Tessaracoccus bendigoensis DSM 12906]